MTFSQLTAKNEALIIFKITKKKYLFDIFKIIIKTL